MSPHHTPLLLFSFLLIFTFSSLPLVVTFTRTFSRLHLSKSLLLILVVRLYNFLVYTKMTKATYKHLLFLQITISKIWKANNLSWEVGLGGDGGFRGGRDGGRGRGGRFGCGRGRGGVRGGGGGFRDEGPPAEVVDLFSITVVQTTTYKYYEYEYQLTEEEKVVSQSKEVQTPHSGGMSSTSIP